MSKKQEITPDISKWIRDQQMFFVATAPRALNGHINVSPKGGDSFRVLGPLEVVYQDFTGSGAETAAHARENGRIVVMFCAFQGPPQIVRIHGHATLITGGDPRYAEFVALKFIKGNRVPTRIRNAFLPCCLKRRRRILSR